MKGQKGMRFTNGIFSLLISLSVLKTHVSLRSLHQVKLCFPSFCQCYYGYSPNSILWILTLFYSIAWNSFQLFYSQGSVVSLKALTYFIYKLLQSTIAGLYVKSVKMSKTESNGYKLLFIQNGNESI